MNLDFFNAIAPVAAIVGLASVGGWVFTTWLRVKNGYPLENSWGKAVYPKTSDEAMERVKPSCAPSWARSRTGSR